MTTCDCRGDYHVAELGQLVQLALNENRWWRRRAGGTSKDSWRLGKKVEQSIHCSLGNGPFLYLTDVGILYYCKEWQPKPAVVGGDNKSQFWTLFPRRGYFCVTRMISG